MTDNSIQFTNRAQDRYPRKHPFQRVWVADGIVHRLTQVGHPWTNGQGERMNGLLKTATVKRYNYATHQALQEHLHSFVMA
ncbi:MAG: integrase core domain-containing protein [Cytophagales bacterium]|nr:integrase core domain-containing protein [Cytophagales bacterium]